MSINIKISVGWLFLNYQQTFAFDFCQLVVWTTVVTLDWAYQTISIQSEPVCLRLFLTDISSCTLLIKIYLSYFLTVWTIRSQSPSSKKWLNFIKWKSLFYNCNYICNLWRHVKTCKFVYKITVCVFSFEASSSKFASTHASMSPTIVDIIACRISAGPKAISVPRLSKGRSPSLKEMQMGWGVGDGVLK